MTKAVSLRSPVIVSCLARRPPSGNPARPVPPPGGWGQSCRRGPRRSGAPPRACRPRSGWRTKGAGRGPTGYGGLPRYSCAPRCPRTDASGGEDGVAAPQDDVRRALGVRPTARWVQGRSLRFSTPSRRRFPRCGGLSASSAARFRPKRPAKSRRAASVGSPRRFPSSMTASQQRAKPSRKRRSRTGSSREASRICQSR